jgi:cell division transport system permease protein
MSLTVFILSSVLLLKQNTNIIFGDASDLYTLTISIKKSKSTEEIQKIVEKIKNFDADQIKNVSLITAKAQLIDVESAFPGYSRGLFDETEIEQILNPLVEVQLTDGANSSTVIEEIKAIDGISDVAFGSDWVDKFKNLFNLMNIILNTVFLLFFIMLSFLISILIRNYLIMSKDRIGLYALTGATPQQSFIDQYLKIVFYTAIAYGIGILSTIGLTVLIKQKISLQAQFSFINERITFLNNEHILLILLGLILNLIISYFISYHYVVKEHYSHD